MIDRRGFLRVALLSSAGAAAVVACPSLVESAILSGKKYFFLKANPIGFGRPITVAEIHREFSAVTFGNMTPEIILLSPAQYDVLMNLIPLRNRFSDKFGRLIFRGSPVERSDQVKRMEFRFNDHYKRFARERLSEIPWRCFEVPS